MVLRSQIFRLHLRGKLENALTNMINSGTLSKTETQTNKILEGIKESC